jgi:hypothetical protein
MQRRMLAAYLLDRADQYKTDSPSWIPLAKAAEAVVNGDVESAVNHGELDDDTLLARVDRMLLRAEASTPAPSPPNPPTRR